MQRSKLFAGTGKSCGMLMIIKVSCFCNDFNYIRLAHSLYIFYKFVYMFFNSFLIMH